MYMTNSYLKSVVLMNSLHHVLNQNHTHTVTYTALRNSSMPTSSVSAKVYIVFGKETH